MGLGKYGLVLRAYCFLQSNVLPDPQETSGDMSDFFLLTDEQMTRLEPYFPKPYSMPSMYDWRILSGITLIDYIGLT